MCGISGVVGFNGRKTDLPELKKMTDPIAYRGPDGEGFWVSASGNVGLAHRRLSILDLSDAGKQPMEYADGRYVITFNGEVYNFIELKAELEAKGYAFRSGTDTEVLLALYADRGEACLKALDGMFAFAIWDNRERTLFCARDRMGEKPFYYRHAPGERFVFGSEMKCLFAVGVQKQVREDRLFSFLAYHAVEDTFDLSSTFYRHVLQLEPAHYLKIDAEGRLTKKRYWEIPPESAAGGPPAFEDACARFLELFETSIKRRLRSDVPVGTSLSGGLDSSSIVVVLNSLRSTVRSFSQKSFSARMLDPNYDEGEHMQSVISQTDVDPYFTWVRPELAIDQIDALFHHNEEPSNSSTFLSQWLVMRLASEQGVPVLIDGQGADEMLAGYTGYFGIYFHQLYLKDRPRLERELGCYRKVHRKPFDTGLQFRLESRYPQWFDRLGQLSRRLGHKRHLRDLNPDFVHRNKRLQPPFQRDWDLNRALRRSSCNGRLTHLLRMADRTSMAFGREVRLPFLSHELIEFVFSLPAHYKIHNGWSKYLLRKSLEPLLPKTIAWRRDKKGFATPQSEWLSHPRLRERIEESTRFLQKDGWITQPSPEKQWSYMEAALLLR